MRRFGLILISLLLIEVPFSNQSSGAPVIELPIVEVDPLSVALDDLLEQENSTLLAQRNVKKSKRRRIPRSKQRSNSRDLAEALILAKKGEYKKASIRLFQLSHVPRYRDKAMQIRYILGLMLYKMQLNQISAFQFINVVSKGNNKYVRQSLEKLSLAADYLGDDTLLNYAMSKIDIDKFPKVHRDMLFYRIGQIQLRNHQYLNATRSFDRVGQDSNYYSRALYDKAMAYAYEDKTQRAIQEFEKLVDYRADRKVNDTVRVAGIVGKARTYYQAGKWDESIDAYRDVPKDNELWHDTLFESSWAYLRAGRFRSALSNFLSLHSDYYENYYLPESLLLRAIVYLYICKYDEMEKVLTLYTKIYKPVYQDIRSYLKTVRDPMKYYNDVAIVEEDVRKIGGKIDKAKYGIPFLVARKIYKMGEFQSSFQYIKKVESELDRIKQMDTYWQNSAIGKYSVKIINNRIKKAKQKAGRVVRDQLLATKNELFDLFEQKGFIRFEMLKGKKEYLKKRMAGKTLSDVQVDEDNERDYYVQNGYEYWPFRGEYWLDEIGNYHYVGTQSCEQ
ncbi:MAG: hypothetical protein KDD50_04600 [Bdellovibrionales bacterium]|nr:hypothetical protein [Bdellovibrionales bacterium]